MDTKNEVPDFDAFYPINIMGDCTIEEEVIERGRKITVTTRNGHKVVYTSTLDPLHNVTHNIYVNGFVFYMSTDHGVETRYSVLYKQAINQLHEAMHDGSKRDEEKAEAMAVGKNLFTKFGPKQKEPTREEREAQHAPGEDRTGRGRG